MPCYCTRPKKMAVHRCDGASDSVHKLEAMEKEVIVLQACDLSRLQGFQQGYAKVDTSRRHRHGSLDSMSARSC